MPYIDYRSIHEDLFLTNYLVQYPMDQFIADIMAPYFTVDAYAGKFWKTYQDNLKLYETAREAGSAAKEMTNRFTSDTYLCKQERLRTIIPVEAFEENNSAFDLRAVAAAQLKEALLRKREDRVATIFRSTGGYGVSTLTATQKWDAYTQTTSNPLENIVSEIVTIASNSGVEPNLIVIPFEVAQKLSNHPDFTEQVKYTSDKFLTTAGIPQTIKGLRVITPNSRKDTAGLEKTATLSYIWGEDVILAYVNPNPGRMGLNSVTTFAEYTDKVRRWMENDIEAEVLEYGQSLDEKVIATNTARVIQSVLS